MQDIIDDNRILIEERGIAIRTALDCGMIWCEPQHIKQILRNRISNAARYGTTTTDPEIVVATSTTPEGWFSLSVDDNDVGVTPAHAELIFGRFQKLSNDKQSSGIGVSIVRLVVDLYGGRAWVGASASGGARFREAFPVNALLP